MIKREIHQRLTRLLRDYPAVALLGPRQVGKTTLARSIVPPKGRKPVYLDLERPADLRKLDDLELFFREHRDYFVIIDEVQSKPEIFSYLRHEIDEDRSRGRFLLIGSASPELVKGVSESLAGRISYLEMTPLSLSEIPKQAANRQKHWLRGGFPVSYNARNNLVSMKWREDFVRSYVERNLSLLFGVAISPVIARNFWSMLAGMNGSVYNGHEFARALGLSAPTVNRYLDLLEGAFLVRRLPAWFVNVHKRIVKAPKIYIRDSGLLHYFSNVRHAEEIPGNIIAGVSWEGYVIEEICRCLPPGVHPFFYRTHQGAEADLVLVKGIRPLAVIEIKYSLQPSLTKGFYEVLRDLKPAHSFVVTPEGQSLRDKQGTKYLSLPDFIQKELPRL